MQKEIQMSKYQNKILGIFSVYLLFVASLSCTGKNEQAELRSARDPAQGSDEIIPTTNNWPAFRGEHAVGVVDGQNLPGNWDGKSGENIQWKTLIPGLAHSSPIIWGEKLFVTTAISSREDVSFRHGLYGDGDASDDWKRAMATRRKFQNYGSDANIF